jgi:hypothetical protein
MIRMMKSRRMRWVGYEARMGRRRRRRRRRRNAYMVLVGKPEGRRPLGRPKHRWVDNIKMDLREMGSGDMDWIDLA